MTNSNESTSQILLVRRRGAEPESTHRGWAVLLDDGRESSAGDPSTLIFTRSCTKPFQALACLVSGAADRFALSAEELALACSSHNGSERHREIAKGILARAGLSESHLRCGASEPFGGADRTVFLQKNEKPAPFVHNCSGKHAAFLLTQAHLGGAPEDYLNPNSNLQKLVRELVGEALDVAPGDLGVYVDGCSAPTFRLPLRALALGFMRLANPETAPPRLAPHLARLRDAIAANRIVYSGHGRLCEAVLAASQGAAIPKNGAEGVYAFGVRGRRAGFAIKIEDGSSRGYEPIVVDVLRRHGFVNEAELPKLKKFADPNLYNAAGIVVGREDIVAKI